MKLWSLEFGIQAEDEQAQVSIQPACVAPKILL